MSRILHCHDVFLEGVVSASGCLLRAADGKQYTDYESGIWCAALGHNHPRINQAVTGQLALVMHLNNRYLGEVSERAAEALLARLGMPLGKCVFLSSGSEAVEFGVQALRTLSGKPLLLTFRESYLSAYGSSGNRAEQEWVLLDWAPCWDCPEETACAEDCPALRQIPFARVGGFVLEPGSSSGKVIFPPAKAVSGLARLVRARGGLVMANEVTTGLGRTGKWFGYEHYGLQPEVAAMGKGLGNGYPVSACALGPGLGERLLKGHFHYAQSHQNDPLGCAVALEVLTILARDGLIERSERVGAWFKARLEELAAGSQMVREVRGRGLMLALELAKGAAGNLHRKLLEQGLLVGLQPDGNLIRFYPAFTMEREHFLVVLRALERALAEM